MTFAACDRRGSELEFVPGTVLFTDPQDPGFTIPPSDAVFAPKEMNGVKLYVFDETGLLFDEVVISKEEFHSGQFKTVLPEGNYTLVAWGGGSEDFLNEGFSEVQLKAGTTNEYLKVKKGETTLDDFRVILNTTYAPEGYYTPARPDFDDLYTASAKVEVKSDGTVSNVDFQFTRNSHVLKVYLINPANAKPATTTRADGDFDVFIEGRNAVYLYDNSLDLGAPALRYLSFAQDLNDPNKYRFDFRILRLDRIRHISEPLLLHIRRNGVDIIKPIDIVKYLISVKDANGKSLYNLQSQIDAAYELNVNIIFDDSPGPGPDPGDNDTQLGVTVTINGWEIIEVEATDIQPLA